MLAVLFEVGEDSPRRVLAPTSDDYDDAGLDWTGGSEPFDDSAWTLVSAAPGGVGYDRGDGGYATWIAHDVEQEMFGQRTSIFSRAEFDVASPEFVKQLKLSIRYDDGFIAWLNGQEVARVNADGLYPAWSAVASSDHEATDDYELIDLAGNIGALRAGTNVLAIRGLNVDAADDDLLLQFTLTGETAGPPIAVDDMNDTDEGEAVAIDVLANDQAGGDPIDPTTIAIASPPAHGTAIANADGTITYTPDPIYNGLDSFTYTVRDNTGVGVPTQVTLVAENAPVRAHVPASNVLGVTWRGGVEPFNDSGWTAGTFGVGYDADTSGVNYNPFLGLNVQTALQNVNTSIYLRSPFTLDNPDDVTSLTLRMRYDDGFAAFINGVPVASALAPASLTSTSAAIQANADANAIVFETFDLTPFRGALRAGGNVLAIHGLNQTLASSDLLIQPELTAVVHRQGRQSNAATVTVDIAPVEYAPIARDDAYETLEGHTLLVEALLEPTSQLIVPAGAMWRYRDNGSFPGNDTLGNLWTEGAYNDGAWATGQAQLGYGDGDEATVVSFGSSSTNKYITTWFRHRFVLDTATATAAESLLVELLRDDGALVYLNGVEIVRDNLPGTLGDGAITAGTLAASAVDFDLETRFFPHTIDLSLPQFQGVLRVGENVLAVEVHQVTASSSDISFDLRLIAQLAPTGVLANDTERDGQEMSVFLDTPPQHGVLDLGGDGAFEYIPDPGFVGVDSFTYRVSDGMLFSEPATVTITVTHLPPIANDDAYEVDEDTTLVVSASEGVLANDTDTQGHALTAVLVSGPANGDLSLAADGSFVYSPRADFAGVDTFVYRAHDDRAASEPANVTIVARDIADPIHAHDDAYAIQQGDTLSAAGPTAVYWASIDAGVNRINPDGTGATRISDDQARNFAIDNVNGKVYWTRVLMPQIVRANLDGSSAEVIVTQASGTILDVDLDLQAGKLYWSDFTNQTVQRANLDGTEVETIIAMTPARGVALDVARGKLYWNTTSTIHRANLDGTTIETLIPGGLSTTGGIGFALDLVAGHIYWTEFNRGLVSRANLDGTNTVVVVQFRSTYGVDVDSLQRKLYFNCACESREIRRSNLDGSDMESIIGGLLPNLRGLAVTPDTRGVLANDGIVDSDPVAELVSAPFNGTIEFHEDGTFLYIPDPGFVGVDQFTYRVTAGQVASNVALVTINVGGVNQPPVAGEDRYVTWGGAPLSVPRSTGLLANDFDANGDALSAIYLPIVENRPQHGVVSVSASGAFTYAPHAGFVGEDSFIYRVSDGRVFNVGKATIRVLDLRDPINGIPLAADDEYFVDSAAGLTVAAPGVLANDDDPEQRAVIAALVRPPRHGTVSLEPGGGFVYTPLPGFFGEDAFTYRVSDDNTFSAPATVVLHVASPRPLARRDEYSATEDEQLLVAASEGVLANDISPTGRPLVASLVTPPKHGTLALSPDGRFLYRPNPDYSGRDSFVYRASDGLSASLVATVSIEVIAVPDAPMASDDWYAVSGGALSINGATELYHWQSGSFRRMNTDGTGDTLINNLSSPLDAAVDPSAGKLYWTRAGSAPGEIWHSNLDGTNRALLLSFANVPVGIALDIPRGQFYWSEPSNQMIRRANLNGTSVQTILSAPASRIALDSAGGKIYWTTDRDNKIQRANLDGTNIETLLDFGPTAAVFPQALELDPRTQKMYWTEPGSNRIRRANFDGTDVEDVQVGLARVGGLALDLDTNRLYYICECDARELRRANLEGSNPEVIATGLWSNSVVHYMELGARTPGLLANDRHVDHLPITAELVAGPANGALVLRPDGTFDYTANAGFTGTDTFTYRVTDGNMFSAPATVALVVGGLLAATTDAIPPATGVSATSSNSLTTPHVDLLSTGLIPGDVTGDGLVDLADLAAIVQYYGPTVSGASLLASLDVNRDGRISVADAIALRNAMPAAQASSLVVQAISQANTNHDVPLSVAAIAARRTTRDREPIRPTLQSMAVDAAFGAGSILRVLRQTRQPIRQVSPRAEMDAGKAPSWTWRHRVA